MKLLKKILNYNRIRKINKYMKLCTDGSYIINDDFSVDVNGNVSISPLILAYYTYNRISGVIPVKFNIIRGCFDCSHLRLESTEGFPEEVYGNFDCSYNYLRSLVGCPKVVTGEFKCNKNNFKNLIGSPKEVGKFYCIDNVFLESLEGSPEYIGDSFIAYNCGLKSLKHSPKEVGGGFCVYQNCLRDIDGMPWEIGGDFDCRENPIIGFKSVSNIEGNIYLNRYIDISNFDGFCKKFIYHS